MVPALQPISGFLNLAPIAPVLPRGRGIEQLVPFVGLAMTDASTLVNLGATRALPLTYTASGSFSAALQTVPATGAVGSPQDGVQRLHMSLDLSLDFELVWGRSAAANAGRADVRESAFRALSDGVTADLLLAALSGSSSSGVDQTLSRLLASDLNTALLTSPVGSIDNAAITTLTGNSGATATLTGELDATATLTLVVARTTASTATLTTSDTTADTTATGTAITAVLATPPADTAASTVALTPPEIAAATTATVTAAATTAVANNTALQRFLTDAAAQAHDAVTNNPAYAAAAAALYASAAVFRSQADNAPAASAFAPGSPVTEVTPARPIDAIPTSLT